MVRPPCHRPSTRPGHGEHGAASIVAVGIVGALVLLTTLTLGAISTYADVRRAAGAADASALAAADAASGAIIGTPCDVATRLAARNGGRLVSCAVDGAVSVVVVAVASAIPGIEPVASARAGPPGSAP
ncbi:Rv3654c family TadE-like protein [Agromyces salentinus]|nr:Rv3654c family TadE-like protein [Agromyces salentinus]